MRTASFTILLLACGGGLELQENGVYAKVVYDPSAGTIPLPNDLVRDAEQGRLAPPTREGQTDAEQAQTAWLNSLDAWGTTVPGSFRLSEPVDPASVSFNTVRVYQDTSPPTRVVGVTLTVAADGRSVGLEPPVGGWEPGGSYAVAVMGGNLGVKTLDGRAFGPDIAMGYLLAEDRLDDPAHERAFPGATRKERLESAAALEPTRVEVDAWLDRLGTGLPRTDVAALWSFTVSDRVELAMDRASQRVPVPFDLLIDPATGFVDLSPAADDTPLEAEAKLVANTFRGFALSANPLFEFTDGIDPSTVTSETVQLWDLSPSPRRLANGVRVMAEEGDAGCRRAPYAVDCKHVFVVLPDDHVPLDPGHPYAIVVTRGVLDLQGREVVPMAAGHFVAAPHALAVDGVSRVSALDDTTASRLEGVRRTVSPLLDQLDRSTVIAAWPFTTMDPLPDLRAAAHLAETSGQRAPVRVHWKRPAQAVLADDAIGDLFPGALNPGPALYTGRTANVKQVVSGTIQALDHLDPVTRRWVEEPTLRELPFWAIVPEGYLAERPLPVIVFGHAIVTDRRFALMAASELADRGFVVISIDWPYHGERLACVDASLVAVPNFLPDALQVLTGLSDPLLYFPPCESGAEATCASTGGCLDARGRPEPFSSFPIIDMQPVSGAAFLDMNDLPHIPDHFRQAFADLSTVMHSLRTEPWDTVLQQRIDTTNVSFFGQSLGSIIGVTWVAARDDIDNAVFNVPGSNLVDLFRTSTYFRPQIEAYFERIAVPEGTYEHARLVAVAKWIVDSIDPHSVAHVYRDRDFPGLIQMDKVNDELGDLIIPNPTTENLARVSGMELIAYPSALHADLIVPILGDAMLEDAGRHFGRTPK